MLEDTNGGGNDTLTIRFDHPLHDLHLRFGLYDIGSKSLGQVDHLSISVNGARPRAFDGSYTGAAIFRSAARHCHDSGTGNHQRLRVRTRVFGLSFGKARALPWTRWGLSPPNFICSKSDIDTAGALNRRGTMLAFLPSGALPCQERFPKPANWRWDGMGEDNK
ncbi:MAG: hypothetical protein WDN04_11565 [Rhodospirillales bacterium]